MLASFLSVVVLAASTHAQFPPKPENLKSITSKLNPDVEISYKQTTICETTEGVKSFSGYVHLPQKTLTDLDVDFDIHTFFWFFESRKDPENSPLVIYLAGGPGESSVFTALNSESGPCYVNPDGKTTTPNPWSFNNDANVLYIDQPVSAGYSYTTLVNGTIDITSETITPLTTSYDKVNTSATVRIGTFSDQSFWATTNTTAQSASALWHFAEHWLTQFPEYTSKNKNIGVWGNSAGGYWVPATAALWHKKINASEEGSPLSEWSIDNIGITNGAIDMSASMPWYPEYTFNNTYQSLIPEEMYTSAKNNITKEDGCNDLTQKCRTLGEEGDPDSKGTNATVNEACQQATAFCMLNVGATINLVGRNHFDIAQKPTTDAFCTYYYPAAAFLNLESTQRDLGAVTNLTATSSLVIEAFSLALPDKLDIGTGDMFRATTRDLEYALQNNIKVSLVYGDRDARCPWTAAEDIANSANYTGHESFLNAGYEMIETNATYKGGAVKQFENFSFSRVFEAGHMISAYQPETLSKIFSRVINGMDVATGQKRISQGYSTEGPLSSWNMVQQKLIDAPETCMVLGSFQDTSPWALLEDGAQTNGNGTGDGEKYKNSAQSGREATLIQAFTVFVAVGVALLS